MRASIIGLVAVFVLGVSGAAFAVPSVFFGEDLGLGEYTPLSSWTNSTNAEADFLSYLTGVGTEDFEGFTNGQGAPLGLVFPGAGTATLQGTGNIEAVTPGTTNGFGRYGTSGYNYWESGSSFSIDFGSPVAAFGFYGIDIGDFDGSVTLSYMNGTSSELVIPHTVGGAGGSVIYYGFYDTDNPFNRIEFGNTESGIDYFGFDDMTIGSIEQVDPDPVPEPATLALMSTGLLGLAGTYFKRRRR